LLKENDLNVVVFTADHLSFLLMLAYLSLAFPELGTAQPQLVHKGCPILLIILQTFLFKQYVIPVYEMFGFLHHLKFPPRLPKKYKGFSKLIKEKSSGLFHFKTIS
jgi:hypothetical protein